MKKLKMTSTKLTFEEGCNKFLEYCQRRNLRKGTIGNYKHSNAYFYKLFDCRILQNLQNVLCEKT